MRICISLLLLLQLNIVFGQLVPPSQYQELKWRMIGPFRAGRTVGAVGIPSQPNVFYMGVNNGGVWKSDDYGRTWKPIFDSAPTGSIGDIAVSPSHPNVIYVGTGEGLHRPDLSVGDGIFKSTDGGKSWQHVGLPDVQQVGRLVVHPTNPDIVFVAGLGHPYGPNEMRGVFRTRDGGKTWDKVLYINHNTGAIQVEFDFQNPDVLYADMWEHREGPWENGSFSGSNSGLYKSVDGGTNWKQLKNGLPGAEKGLGRIGVGISPSHPNRLYATVDAREGGGIYRSDDAGENWRPLPNDRRTWGRGSDFAEIRVHPSNPDIVFSANVAFYKSLDGGHSWATFKGAPGGDDYHRLWINPHQPDIMLLVADQGAVVTVNGGRSWSSWYNQPTAQLYHISTDNAYPYMVYGGQQESGAVGVLSRGNGGQISFRDWMGVGADEYAYVAPNPKDPNIVYGGRITRFDKRTGQTQNVAPEALRSGKYRMLRTLPLLFHPADATQLLFGANVLWRTFNGGASWEIISPDLTRKQYTVPENIGDFRTEAMNTMAPRGVIYSIAPSPLDKNILWVGTDDGLVHITTDDGKSWKDVTPPQLSSWSKIAQIDAGHFDVGTAYIAVNAIRKDDQHPHIFVTRDSGKTWTEIANGMNPSGPVNAVREDKLQKGLLFAGTEREVYFSLNDGAHWQSLRLNMPATSIRDLVIQEDDVVVGTHGRSIWILDNISHLRGMASARIDKPTLFKPAMATRVRFNMFSDTPIPPDEPMGQNPPDGAMIDYFLAANANALTLEILDAQGNLIRKYSHTDLPEVIDSTSIQLPMYWIRPWQKLQTGIGHHRFVWDLRFAPPKDANPDFSIAAVYKNTPSGPGGPLVRLGRYTVRLTADGIVLTQPLVVRKDPRVTISEADLNAANDLAEQCFQNYNVLQNLIESIDRDLANPKKKWKKGEKEVLQTIRGSGKPDAPNIMYGSISEAPVEKETLVSLQEKYLHLIEMIQSADVAPTGQVKAGVARLHEVMQGVLLRKPK